MLRNQTYYKLITINKSSHYCQTKQCTCTLQVQVHVLTCTYKYMYNVHVYIHVHVHVHCTYTCTCTMYMYARLLGFRHEKVSKDDTTSNHKDTFSPYAHAHVQYILFH